MLLRSSAGTLLFQSHTETLPVKPWLQTKAFLFPGRLTAYYAEKLKPYIYHCFLDCHDETFLWDIVQRIIIKKAFPLSTFGVPFLPCDDTGGVPCDMVMLICMHTLWKARMAVRHDDVDARSAQHTSSRVLYIWKTCGVVMNGL